MSYALWGWYKKKFGGLYKKDLCGMVDIKDLPGMLHVKYLSGMIHSKDVYRMVHIEYLS